MPPPHPIRQLGSWLLIVLPVLLATIAIGVYAQNLPYWDDYMVQDHLAMLKAQGSFRARLDHLFDQHWEHRIVWSRVIFGLYVALTGSLNYVGLTYIGFIGLLALLVLTWLAFRRIGLQTAVRSPAWFIPVPFWLVNFESHENLIWSMASMSNFWILFFACGTFYALAIRWVWLAIVCSLLATFTLGSGPIVFAAGLAMLLWQRRWRTAVGWAGVMAVTVGGYFYHYQRITFFPSPFRYPFTDWVKAVFVFFGGFLDPYPYTGISAIGYESLLWPVVLLGVVLTLGFGYFLWPLLMAFIRKTAPTEQKDDFWPVFFLGTSLFLLATALITVYARVGFAGPAYLLQSRYKIYSGLVLTLIYLYSLHTWQRATWLPRFGWAVGISTVLFSMWANYLCLEGLINQHRRTVAEYVTWRLNTPKEAQQATRSVFTPPAVPYADAAVELLTANPTLTGSVPGSAFAVQDQPSQFIVPTPNSHNPAIDQPVEGTYVVMADSAHTYVMASRPVRPTPLAISSRYFSPDRAQAHVLKEKLQAGRYRVGRLTFSEGKVTPGITPTTLLFSGQ